MQKLICLFISVILISTALGEIPPQINYQGRLSDNADIPLNGEYQLAFSIYDMPEGGNLLWTSGPRNVMVENGLFSYVLGQFSQLPDSVFLVYSECWLGISVDGGPEMMPRTFITSGAFAFRAKLANGADFSEAAGHADHAYLADEAIVAGNALYSDTAEYARSGPAGGGGWSRDDSTVRVTDDNDFVCIGTASPLSKLTVDKGHALIRGIQMWDDPGDTAKLILGDINHGLLSIYGQGLRLWTYGDGNHSIDFGTHYGDDFMTIDGSGCIAINTSANVDEKLLAYQISGPGKVAIHGSTEVDMPSSGGGIGVLGSFSSDGVGGVGVYGSAIAGGEYGGLVGVYGYTDDPTSYAIYGEGGIAATGPITALVETGSYGLRETYTIQSADNWCEDFGTGKLVEGVAIIHIDSIFAEAIQAGRDYHIFLTPLSDCGLYVDEKHRDYFIVKAQGNRVCGAEFDYRIVGKRKGLENHRLRSAEKIRAINKAVHYYEKQDKEGN